MNYKLSEEIRLAHRLKYRISGTWADKVAELEDELSLANSLYALVVKERDYERHLNQRLRGEFELTWYALRNNQVSIGDRIDNALKIIKQTLEKET